MENRTLLSTLLVNGTAGDDSIAVSVSGSNLHVVINGTPTDFSTAGLTALSVNGQDGNDTIIIVSLPGGLPTTVSGGAGNDTARIGGGDLDSNVLSDVTVTGDAGNDGVIIDDSLDGVGGDDYTVTGAAVQKNSGLRTVTYASAELLTINASAQNSTFNINSLALGMPLIVNGGSGNETYHVGNGDLQLNVLQQALVSIHGGGGTNSLVVDDASSTGGLRNYVISSDSISNSIGNKYLNYDSMTNITVNAANRLSLYTVSDTALGENLVLNGGSVVDQFDLGGDYQPFVNFDKLEHLDSVEQDIGNTYREHGYVITDTGGSFGSGLATYGNNATSGFTGSTALESDVFTGSSVINLAQKDGIPFNLHSIDLSELSGNQSPPASVTFTGFVATGGTVTQTFTLDGTFGMQTFTFPGTFSNLAFVQWVQAAPFHQFDNIFIDSGPRARALDGPVTVHGNGGTDLLTLDDTASTANDTYTLSRTTVASSASATITYDSTDQLQIFGGAGDNTFAIQNFNNDVTLYGQGGNDTFTNPFDDLNSNWNGNLTINGGSDTPGSPGGDTITLDDSGDDTATEYTIAATNFGVTGAIAGLTTNLFPYSNIEQFNWTTNTHNNTIQILSSNASTDYQVHGGAGNDTFNLGVVGGSAEGIDGNVAIYGDTGTDTFTYNDTTNADNDTYTITDGSIVRTNNATVDYTTVETFTIAGGAGKETYEINSSATTTPLTINGGANNDTCNIGGSTVNNVESCDAPTTLNGNGGTDTIGFDDLNDVFSGDIYTITATTLQRSGSALHTYGTVETVIVNGSNQASAINVNSTASGTTVKVFGNGGNDTVNAGNGNWDANLLGTITLDGGSDAAGVDMLGVNDLSDTGDDGYSFSSSQVTKTSSTATIFYSNFEGVALDANGGNNAINVSSANGGTTIRGNGGVDTFGIGETAPGTFLTVDGGAGLDAVNVNLDSTGYAGVQFANTQDLASLQIFNGGVVRVNSGGDKVLSTQSLSTTGTGTLDLTDEDMIWNYSGASPIGIVHTLIQIGYHGGDWTGTGITSSSAATVAATTSNIHKTALGYAEANAIGSPATFDSIPIDSTTVLVRYTLSGDANIDGTVNTLDFTALAASFITVNKLWTNGDFNYDVNGTPNALDFNALATNFGQSLPAPLPTGGLFSQSAVATTVVISRNPTRVTETVRQQLFPPDVLDQPWSFEVLD